MQDSSPRVLKTRFSRLEAVNRQKFEAWKQVVHNIKENVFGAKRIIMLQLCVI